jgi:hypothetical protein
LEHSKISFPVVAPTVIRPDFETICRQFYGKYPWIVWRFQNSIDLEAADYNRMAIFEKQRTSMMAEKKILTPTSPCLSDPRATRLQMMARSREKSSNLSCFSRFELLKKQSFVALQALLVLENLNLLADKTLRILLKNKSVIRCSFEVRNTSRNPRRKLSAISYFSSLIALKSSSAQYSA